MSLHNSYVMNSSTLGSLGASNFTAACYASHTNLGGTNPNAAVFHTNDKLLNTATDVIETDTEVLLCGIYQLHFLFLLMKFEVELL